MDTIEFQKKINLKFNDSALIQQVFVHRSYLNENRDFHLGHNERLEFLGDAVMELVVTDYLYRNYSNPEGELTNWRSALVKGETISQVAQKLQMEKLLMFSRGEQKSSGKARQMILANAFEALVGAIYLDQGYDKVKEFIETYLIVLLNDIIQQGLYQDSKSKLQELTQNQFGITPEYRLLKERGPDHNREFSIAVMLGSLKAGVGNGPSKQRAQQESAADALKNYEKIKSKLR